MDEQLRPDPKKIREPLTFWRKLTSKYETRHLKADVLPMDDYVPSFRLEFRHTFNEYRIVDGNVQFRPEEGEWRKLDLEDIQMHFALKTPVASWIRNTTDRIHHLPLAV